ncbi:ABC transporter ATP-binding protein [Chelativorans sp. YIM 93263]|uniref:ABC transporter ATP-binding protein n=1 Tax=Chelativorans sp. YIM 93263 TaxID=2906648 RepID=UPI002379EB4F|nr:ABC transporter ATP-binding protein [Chelativorans sp. YIM 93263]
MHDNTLQDHAALEMRDAAAGYGERLVFEGLDLSVARGRVTALCGPNGCGKSTVLRAMRAMLPLRAGAVHLDGDPLENWKPRALARRIAMLSQSPSAPEEMTVVDLVRLGRYAHRRRFGRPGAEDRETVAAALAATSIEDLSDRPIGTLSGGQMQRVWIAMVIAQAAPVILLDEPTNHLDIAHALDTLSLVRKLSHEEGKTVVVVLHDLNLAARFADDIVFVREGKVASAGPVGRVFHAENIEQVFGIHCRVLHDEETDRPFCIPLAAKGG